MNQTLNFTSPVQQFIKTWEEYKQFNNFIANNPYLVIGKQVIFTRNKNHNYKILITDNEEVFNYQLETNFKYDNSCVRYWCNIEDSYYKNQRFTVQSVNDKGFVTLKGENGETWLSSHSLYTYEIVPGEINGK